MENSLLLIHGKILTMDVADYEDGFIYIKDGKIQSVGDMASVPKDTEAPLYDAKGAFVSPGFIDAHCHIGMWEDGVDLAGDDGNEESDPITPQMRAIDAVNPMDPCFHEAFLAGVTTVVTGPGSANLIGGQFVAMSTSGRRIDDMVLKAPAAMKFAFGENPKSVYRGKNAPYTRMGIAALIRETLYEAKKYKEDWQDYEDGKKEERPDFDLRLESLLPVLNSSLLVKAHAHRADDIFTAIRIAKEFNLKLTIEHCTEGHLIADILKEEGYGVCVGPSLTDRSKTELRNLSMKTAGILAKEGIPVAIITDHPETPAKYLPLCAAMAVKEGMDKEAALSAITSVAAKVCDLDHLIGSITPGKIADIAVFSGHPLDFESKCLAVIQKGEICIL